MKKPNFSVVDLFSGCGGLSLGFQNAGFDVLAAYDNWKPAVEVYKNNFNHPIFSVDLGNTNEAVTTISQFNPDFIIGGPPCQDFSHAGKRNENGGRANLTINFAEIIRELKPKFFLMENVERISKTKTYQEAVKIFKEAGYGLSAYLFNASLYGVPQLRKRFIVVGQFGGVDNALLPYFKKHQSSKPMTIRDYFGKTLDVEHYYRHPRNYSRRAVYSIDEPSPTIRGVNRPIPGNYKAHPGDSTKIIEKVRPLTTIERSYIQTFPKDFKFTGSKTNLEQMIGNAVPVKLAESVAQSILEYINDDIKIPYDLFTPTRTEESKNSYINSSGVF